MLDATYGTCSRSSWRGAPGDGGRGRASGPGAGGVRGDAGGVGAAAADPVPEVGGDDQAAVVAGRRFAAFTDQYPWEWEPAEVEAFFDHLRAGTRLHGVGGAALPELPADVLRVHHRCPLRVARRPAWSGSAGRRRRSCTSGTRSPTSASIEGSRDGGRLPTRRSRRYSTPLTAGWRRSVPGAVRAALTAMRDSALLKTYLRYGLRRQEGSAWTWLTCGAIRRRRAYGRSVRCSSAGGSPLRQPA